MRIHLISDLHLEFGAFYPPPVAADVTVLAGDIHKGVQGVRWALQHFPDRPVLYVLGNHEYYGHTFPNLIDRVRKKAAGTHVHVLECGQVTLGGLRFLGCTLWSDLALFGNVETAISEVEWNMADYYRIRVPPQMRRLRAHDTIACHEASRAWLEATLPLGDPARTVVVTHHAPCSKSLHPSYQHSWLSPAFISRMDDLVEASEVPLWIHGHTHNGFDYQVGRTRIRCNPRGYPGESKKEFDPGLIIEV